MTGSRLGLVSFGAGKYFAASSTFITLESSNGSSGPEDLGDLQAAQCKIARAALPSRFYTKVRFGMTRKTEFPKGHYPS